MVHIPLASVNTETGTMLASYTREAQVGTSFTITSDRCPFALDTMTSQVRGVRFEVVS